MSSQQVSRVQTVKDFQHRYDGHLRGGRAIAAIGADEMKEGAAYQAASAGQQSVESSGTAAVPPFVEAEKPRAKARPKTGSSAKGKRR